MAAMLRRIKRRRQRGNWRRLAELYRSPWISIARVGVAGEETVDAFDLVAGLSDEAVMG